MKKSVFITILILLILSGCSNKTESEVNVSDSSEKKKSFALETEYLAQLKTEGSLLRKEYDKKEQVTTSSLAMDKIETIKEVEKFTEIGIEGVVTSAEPFVYKEYDNGSPFTKITIHVRNTLYGKEKMDGKEIVVYEPGGLISKKDLGFLKKRSDEAPTLTDEELAEKVVVNINGVHNSVPGDEVVLYLIKVNGKELGQKNDFYQIAADYLTRFDKNENNEMYERPDTEILLDKGNTQESTIEMEDLETLNETISEKVEKVEKVEES